MAISDNEPPTAKENIKRAIGWREFQSVDVYLHDVPELLVEAIAETLAEHKRYPKLNESPYVSSLLYLSQRPQLVKGVKKNLETLGINTEPFLRSFSMKAEVGTAHLELKLSKRQNSITQKIVV